MSTLIFSNPWAWWTLLSIPTILFIHFFQRQSKTVLTSTLFLLHQKTPESSQGRAFERIKSSLLLWVQILIALLFTCLLLHPTWPSEESVLKVVMVIDSSQSMSAFKNKCLQILPKKMSDLAQVSKHTHWHILESESDKKNLYSGEQLSLAIDSLKDWAPSSAAHDFEDTLNTARTLAGQHGLLIFISDHNYTLNSGEILWSIGEPINNVGFSGVRILRSTGGAMWEAHVKNYGQANASRLWWMEAGSKNSTKRQIELAPGQSHRLKGSFPKSHQGITLHLDEDAFSLDDHLPLIRPWPKKLSVNISSTHKSTQLLKRFFNSVDNVDLLPSPADLSVITRSTGLGAEKKNQALVVLDIFDHDEKGLLGGMVMSSKHPWMEGLNFQGLLISNFKPLPINPSWEVLLFKGKWPLVSTYGSGNSKKLHFHFPLDSSNAEKLPSTILLLHRFTSSLRSHKVAYERRNFELNQKVTLPYLAEKTLSMQVGEQKYEALDFRNIPALKKPGFFSLKAQGKDLLDAAVHFADIREANFKNSIYKMDELEVSQDLHKKLKMLSLDTHLILGIILVLLFCSWALQSLSPTLSHKRR